MRNDRFSVLWLCGQAGSGKSEVGWALYEDLARSGVRAGFLDIDQLGIFLPAPLDDPERFLLKERNVSSVAANFRAAGCDTLVVAGELGLSTTVSAATVPSADLTVCRLRAAPDELLRRLTVRGAPADLAKAWISRTEESDWSALVDVCVDTDGRTVAEVTRSVREHCGGLPPTRAGARTEATGPPPAAAPGGEVLLVCGATGVGKSAVGFQVFCRQLRSRHTAAYMDLGQLGFISPEPPGDPGGHRFRARNAAAMWQAQHQAGARRLVLSGPVPDARAADVYTGALSAADVTLCRLHAGSDELARRIARRGRSFDWPEPGDPLIGRSGTHLRLVARQAAATAQALEHDGLGDIRVDTDGLSVREAAALVGRLWQAAPRST